MTESFNIDIDTFVQGNNGSVLPLTIKKDGAVVSLDGATVRVAIKHGTYLFTKQAVITDSINGKCEITLTRTDLAVPGLYFYQPTITYSDDREFSGDVKRFSVLGKISGEPPVVLPSSIDISRLGINVNNKLTIDGIEQIGGSGDGVQVFQTVADLEAAFPNGSTTPVWVVAENDWYYWDGVIISDTTAPTVTVSPNGGTFATTQQVTLTANETATIYYTLDGSTPTTASSVYSTALTISATSTLKFFGKDTAGNQSAVQSVSFTINAPDTTAPTVNISPAAGTFASAQSVTLTASEPSTIYYTLDGSTPTTSSTVYSTPISVSATTTIKYFAKDTAGNSGTVQTATFTIDTTAPNPVTNLTAGTVTSSSIPVSWTLSSSGDVANYEVAYSSDGGTNYTVASAVVNASSTSYTVSGLSASQAYIVRVVAIDGVGNRSTAVTVNATTSAAADTTAPTITSSPVGGTYSATQSVTLTANETATIYYTTDGSTPVYPVSGTTQAYSAPISISATTTLKYIGRDTAGNVSTVQSQTYTIDAMTITASPASGTYATTQNVTLSSNVSGGTIYYTTDGSKPTTSSTIYSGGNITLGSSGTIRAIVKDGSGNISNVQPFYYYVALTGTGGHYSYSNANTNQLVTKTSGITFDQIEIDIKPNFATGVWQYSIDFRTAGVTNGYFARTSSNVDEIGAGFSSVAVNGVNGTTGTAFVTDATRQTVKATLNTPTTLVGNGKFMQTTTNHLNGNIYSVKFLSGGNVVANFDLTNNYGVGIMIDNVNGLQLSNSGGTWVAGT
jgi:predicted 3-demethylubiquinone-9 3-methyltransferase (glyoxalase superfamily)